MTTATQSEPSRSDAPRRRPQADGPSDYPVLIRLPNLEADASKPETSAAKTPLADEKFAAGQAAATSQAAQPTTGDVQPNSTPLRAEKGRSWVSPHVMGWVWRTIIIAAAVGLVVLAYKIINGPGDAVAPVDVDTAPAANDIPAPMPQVKDVTARAIESLAPAAPAAASPAPTANYVDQKGYHETNFDPHGHSQPVPTFSTAPATSPLTPNDGTLPIGPTEGRPGAWETESPAATPNSGSTSRPWNASPGRQGAAARPWAMPADQDQHNTSDDWSQPENYNYPQTSSDTWRDYPGSNTPPPQGPSRTDGAKLPESWTDGSYSAQREAWPGTARLRGEIEQPPLR